MGDSESRASLRAWLSADPLLHGAPADVLDLCVERGMLRHHAPGAIVRANGDAGMGLFLVLRGHIRFAAAGAADDPAAGDLRAGEWLGIVEAVTGEPAHADAVAVEPCNVLGLDHELQRAVGERFEPFDARLAERATRALRSRVFRRALATLFEGGEPALITELMDRATEVTLPRGACLMREGEPSDAWYVLTSGRLGVFTSSPQGVRRGADLSPGAPVGEIGLITGGARTATVVADRDASLMRLARADFERFADAHPAFARRLMSTVVQRLVGQSAPRRAAGARMLVLVPASDDLAMRAGVQQLGASLRSVGAALCSRATFEADVGRRIDRVAAADPTHPLWNQFDAWLENCQAAHELLVLDAGAADDLWQRECLQRADHLLWLAEPAAPGAQRPPDAAGARLQRLLGATGASRATVATGAAGDALRCTLLLLHPPATPAPRNTRAWLDAARFDRHLHLRLDDAATMDRAARLLAGRGFGLALSGGGARGFAHIGVLRAFVELGVPIDCIGGTSIGAIEAGQYALGLSIERMLEVNRYVASSRPFKDYTLPLVALAASRRRDACIRFTYGDALIEDLWVPCLVVSADLTAGEPAVHERGSLALAVGASCSIPGALVPVVDGERLLVDGGVFDNLPAELVKARCGGTVFASCVAPSDAVHAPPGGFPSAWSLLADDLLPWRRRRPTPRIGALLLRTMTLGSAEQMRRAAASIDVLIEPDVSRWGILQMSALDPLVEAGYRAAMPRLLQWRDRARSDPGGP